MGESNKIRYSEKFFTKKFSDERSKDAYLKACKWLAKYVLSKESMQSNVEFSIEKIDSSTFQLNLYVVLSEDELRQRHCQICKDTHSSFYISEQTNCEWCKLKAYHRRADEMLNIKKEHYKSILRASVEGRE